ncbi:MAG: 30S ribosome-binding factor RbfA [Anaerolineae bacterium]
MATRRQRRVAEQIHRELSMLLMRKVRDPRLEEVTITEVRITPDLLIARVFFSVLGEEEERREALAGLESAVGFLRTQLGARIRLRSVPELTFELDESAEYGRRIEELLAEIALEDPTEDGPEPA